MWGTGWEDDKGQPRAGGKGGKMTQSRGLGVPPGGRCQRPVFPPLPWSRGWSRWPSMGSQWGRSLGLCGPVTTGQEGHCGAVPSVNKGVKPMSSALGLWPQTAANGCLAPHGRVGCCSAVSSENMQGTRGFPAHLGPGCFSDFICFPRKESSTLCFLDELGVREKSRGHWQVKLSSG